MLALGSLTHSVSEAALRISGGKAEGFCDCCSWSTPLKSVAGEGLLRVRLVAIPPVVVMLTIVCKPGPCTSGRGRVSSPLTVFKATPTAGRRGSLPASVSIQLLSPSTALPMPDPVRRPGGFPVFAHVHDDQGVLRMSLSTGKRSSETIRSHISKSH